MKSLAIEMKWALIFAAVSLGWMLLERIWGLHDALIHQHAMFSSFFAIPAIAVYVFALFEKRNKYYGGEMTYMQGFLSGLLITLFVTILSPLTQYITSTLITPDFFLNAIAYAVNSGLLSQEAAELEFSLKNYMVKSLIGAPVMGIITSAIVAIFTRRRSATSSLAV